MELAASRRDEENLAKAEAYLANLVKLRPGSFLEIKERSLVYHYRRATAAVKEEEVSAWTREINSLLHGSPWVCQSFSRALEIKAEACTKLNYLKELQKGLPKDMLFVCFGDDLSEQEIFDELHPDQLVSVAVGERIRRAGYSSASPRSLGDWLNRLTAHAQQKNTGEKDGMARPKPVGSR
jgi:trehalose 6-phosphate synthase/phosphatase